MKLDRPQAGVPWVPSRHRHALFRLIAAFRLMMTPAERCANEETQVLAIDRDQSNVETYVTTALVWFTLACFFAELLSQCLHPGAAIPAAMAIAMLSVSLGIVLNGVLVTPVLHLLGLPRGPHEINTASAVFLLEIALAASYFALSDRWVRIPAWIFLGSIALNGMAAIILFTIRKRVELMEERCVA